MFRRIVFAGGVVLVALIGYAIKQLAFPSPEDSVQRFFDALQARNMNAAAEETESGLDYGANSYGMWTVLANEHYQPPTGMRMGGWQNAPTAEGERVVAVQYELADTTYSSLLKLRRQGPTWRIVNGAGTVQPNVASALLNGQRLAGSGSWRLLPGIYQVATNPIAPLLRASPVEVVVTPGSVLTTRLAPSLATDAQAKVKQYLEVLVKACETNAGASKTDCPYKGIDVSGLQQVQWKLVSLPELTIEQSGPDSVRVSGAGPGSVRLNAVDGAGGGIDRVDSFLINGKCVENDGSVSCTFSA